VLPEPTTDADVTGRRYLLIDVDPTRPAGVCATDTEKAAAWEVAGAVRGVMAARLSSPIIVDSGNGFHLYYQLPAEMPGGHCDSASDPIARLLAVLARKFDADGATIDTKVYNPSRIMKIPGTWAKKGRNSADRPHRQSRVIEVPAGWSA
jgi:hypothetical protein